MAETINGLFAAEVINIVGPSNFMTQVEWDTLKWVDRYNPARLHSATGFTTPHEAEEAIRAIVTVCDTVA